MATNHYIPKDQIRQLSQRSDLTGALLVFHCWATILAAGALFFLFPNVFTFIIAIVIIGGRQLGMAILMHDAAHGTLFKTPSLNKYFGQVLLAYPIGTDLPAYRKYHLKHHLFTQQENDPDLDLSAAFPISRKSLWRKVFRDLSGQTALKLRLGQFLSALGLIKQPHGGGEKAFNVNSMVGPYLFNFLGFAICYFFGVWWVYFVLWLLPLFTVFQLVLRIRNIAEHALTSNDNNPLQHARTTYANWIERAVIAPYWVNYHVEHHVYMYVPCWQLKRLHKAMKQHGHAQNMEIKKSYADILRMAAPV